MPGGPRKSRAVYFRRRLWVAVMLMFVVFAAVMLVRSLTSTGGDDDPTSSLDSVPGVVDESASSSTSDVDPVDPSTSNTSADATDATTTAPTGSSSSTLPEAVEVLATDPTAPVVDAAAYAVYDLTDDEWLSATNADSPRPVGSLIKLLTAYVVMQAGDPAKVVTIPDLDIDPLESQIGLIAGEELQRDTLLRAMMIVSANDAAEALAIDIAGNEAQFVTMMNAAADDLGLDGTTAANPSGLDATGSGSTARDVIELTDMLMADETFRTTVARREARLHGQVFPATNELLATYEGADGVKTGSTTQGGFSVVASATRDGRSIAVAVLGASTDEGRFTVAAELLDWAFAQP